MTFYDIWTTIYHGFAILPTWACLYYNPNVLWYKKFIQGFDFIFWFIGPLFVGIWAWPPRAPDQKVGPLDEPSRPTANSKSCFRNFQGWTPPPHKLKGKYNELRYIRIIFETNANFYAQNRSDIKLLTKLKIDKFAKVPTLFNKIQEYSNKSHY